MSQLTLTAIPGFFDLADSAIAAGQVLTDSTMLAMSHNGKFATVRGKLIFMGFYANGNTVPTPIDPDDGYAYARTECQFMCMIYSNRAPAPGFVPGQALPPAQSSSQAGPLYNFPGGWAINDVTGLVTLWTTYYSNGTETVNNDGIIKVYAICSRMSLTTRPGPSAPPRPTPAPSAPTPPEPAPSGPAGTTVAAVSLSAQTASLGSVTSPVTLFTVGDSSAEFTLSCAIDCFIPVDERDILNSQGNYASALVTLVYGWTYAGNPQPGSNTIYAEADDTNPPASQVPASHISAFEAAAGTIIWYYTIWAVDSEIAAETTYDLNITLTQLSP
ncbi:MAG: hypothetical protein ABSF73_01190 [Terriglobia bacterium]|jgi:hypothetical protein